MCFLLPCVHTYTHARTSPLLTARLPLAQQWQEGSIIHFEESLNLAKGQIFPFPLPHGRPAETLIGLPAFPSLPQARGMLAKWGKTLCKNPGSHCQ